MIACSLNLVQVRIFPPEEHAELDNVQVCRRSGEKVAINGVKPGESKKEGKEGLEGGVNKPSVSISSSCSGACGSHPTRFSPSEMPKGCSSPYKLRFDICNNSSSSNQ